MAKLASFRSATEHQIGEALEIERGEYDELLNSMAEWGMNKIPRQVVQEDEDPQPHQEAAAQQKRGPPLGNDDKNQGAPKITEMDAFNSQYTQRRKRRRIARRIAKDKEKDEPVTVDQHPSPPNSQEDSEGDQLANLQSIPSNTRPEMRPMPSMCFWRKLTKRLVVFNLNF